MIRPIQYISPEEETYEFNITRKIERGTLSIASMGDIHFGVIDSKTEYTILEEQFINKIQDIELDVIAIPGDLFHRKYMSNTDPILYANKFIANIIAYGKRTGCVIIVVEGTKEHDAGQLKLFYHYMEDPDIDIRIVENIQFEYVKGTKILCIPELYGVDESIYREYLFYSGYYDMCIMHGTIKGSIRNNNVGQGRLFTINDFKNCMGPIISGHVHTGGCFNSHFYYTGSPLRWEHGQEGEKGFLILLYNLDTRRYYMHLVPIQSFRYITINLDELISADPKDIINYINKIKEDNIDYLRIEFTKNIQTDNLSILKNYYSTNGTIAFKVPDKNTTKESVGEEQKELLMKYDYVLNNKLSHYEILAKFINDEQDAIFVEANKIKQLVEEK